MIEDASVWAQWFAGWHWWNFVMVFGGAAGALYFSADVWIPLLARTQADTQERAKKDRSFPLWLAPVVYPVIWFKKFEAWASSGEADDPVSDARMIVFFACILLLFLVGAFLILFFARWTLEQLFFYIQFGEFADLL